MNKFLDSLKHALVEEDPNAATQPEPAAQPKQQQQTRPSTAPTGIPSLSGLPSFSGGAAPATAPVAPVFHPTGAAPAPDANLTQTYVGKLREQFAKGPYAATLNQFNTTMESLAEDLPQEGSRFRAALKVMQSTPDKLSEAFQSLNGVLDTEYGKLQNSVAQQKANEVDAREAQVVQINSQIEQKNREIQSLMETRDGINGDIITAKTKLGAIVASFEGAVSQLKTEVADSLQKLQIYFPKK